MKKRILSILLCIAVIICMMPATALAAGPYSSVPLTLTVSSYSAPFINGSTGQHNVSTYKATNYISRSVACGTGTNANGSATARFVGSNETGWTLVIDVAVGNYSETWTTNARITNKDMSEATGTVTFGMSWNTQGGTSTYISISGGKDLQPPVEDPKPVKAVVSATKTLDGEVPEDGAFQFVLKDANDIDVARAQNNGNGIVDFNLPEFKEEGTFEYTMSEVNGQNNDINYDESVYKVKVTVTEEDNTLKAAVSYFDKDGNPINSTTPEFANTTKPDLENPTDEQVKEALKDVQIDVSCINKDADHSNKYFKLVEIPDGYTVATPELQDGVYVAKVTVSAEAAKNAYNKAEESKGKTHVLAEGVADEFLYLQYKDGNWYLRVDDPDKQILFNVICETDGVEEFTVRYTDGVDGQEIFADQVTNNLKYGDATPAFAGTPTREGYTFVGWTPEVAEKVTGNATYTATWSKNETGGGGGTVTYYTVKWNNYDNTTLETDYCTYGQMPKYDGATPVKPADDKYTYEFIGWDKEVVKVTGNAVYTAQFKAVAKEPADPVNPADPTDPTKPEKPAKPEKPQKPATPEASGNTDAEKSEVPKTADANDLMLWAALLLAAGTGLAGTALRKRKADSGK
ncbi:MAG: FctA domain-containing protein [Lachnospiraceae bacterium]|nr:FctA domain-containing protein [Lachnospiraceae bacterium]